MSAKHGFILEFTYILSLLTGITSAEPNPLALADPARSSGHPKPLPPVIGNPRITEHPQDDYFAKNEPATLNCKAEGDPKPTITWYRNGELVETNRENPLSHRMLLDNGQLFFLRVIHSKSNRPDIGEYYCNATNIHGTALSRTALVQIAVLKEEFRQEPTDTTTAVGETVVLHCKPPRGKPDPKVIWRKGGHLVQPSDQIQIQEDGDLVITAVGKKDVGEYMCSAINTGGERQSSSAQLRVLDVPVFNKLPKAMTVEKGQNVEFHCVVVGDGPIKVQWSKEDEAINFGRSRIMSDHTLRIEAVQPDDEGVYICSAENAAGSTQATARLTVFAAPVFVISPQDQTVARGRTVTLQCVATGNPPPTVFWSKDGNESLMLFPNRDTGRYSVAEDGTFRIERVEDSDAGVYKCEALNVRGQASAAAKVQVRAHDPRPPPIIKFGPENQTLPLSGDALLRCSVLGKPKPALRWYKNRRPLEMRDARMMLLDSGTLQISNLKIQDTGTYTCKAVSETGETTWDAFLAVEVDSGQSFSRSLTVSSLPSPPTKPLVSEITDTSVHLSWTPGARSATPQVDGFYVEYFGYETTDGWVTATRGVQTESYTVEQLRPETTYVFLLRAKNENGVGVPSQLSDPIRTLAKRGDATSSMSRAEIEKGLEGNIVEVVKAQSLNSSSISIRWKVVKGQKFVQGFYVRSRHILDIRRLKYGQTATARVPSTANVYTITGLKSYSWYDICVSAYNRDVQSRCSSPVKVQTETFVLTTGVPDDVTIRKMSNTSILVSWLPPKTQNERFKISAYKIRCVSADETQNCSQSTSGRTHSIAIKRLRPGLKYHVQVAAQTSQGLGDWSQMYIVGEDPGSVFNDVLESLETSTKPVTSEEPEEADLMKKPWFIGILIGTVGATLWLILCVFTVWLCKRKKNKKQMKEKRYYTGVPAVHKGDDSNRNMLYPPQYGLKDQVRPRATNDLDLPPEFRVLLPPGNKEPGRLQEDNIYKMVGNASFPELKTFYQKIDPVAPYATTTLIQQQQQQKQQQQQMLTQRGLSEHMFRPINQGYIQHSEGSGDSCQKPEPSTASNTDNSRQNSGMLHHSDHSDNMQSPTSDSGSHTTDENGCLLKQKKKNMKNVLPNKQAIVNWAELLPPPPEHPPPSECGDPPSYSEVKGDNRENIRSPISPVSFSQVSACSCPNPHTQTPVPGWNVPVYSDDECQRCHSEKYYDPVAYCQNPYLQRAHSPKTQTLQHMNNRNIHNLRNNINFQPSPSRTPNNVTYPYSQPHRATPPNPTNCAAPAQAYQRSNSNNAMNVSSHSDNEGNMAFLQSYRITPRSDTDYQFLGESEWGPGPAPPVKHCEQDSGMGMEEEPCMDVACRSSLPATANECVDHSLYPARENMSSSVQEHYSRDCDSPESEGADYAADSDLEPPHEPTDGGWVEGTDQCNTDCSSARSSSSGDGTFLNEADFASAVAKAAEMSGLTVVGTTVCDLNNKAKKEKRQRRPARPVSPGYSTDSNYGSIGVIHRPYPKSHRKRQLVENGKKPATTQCENNNQDMAGNPSFGVYDLPYSKPSFNNNNNSNPASPAVPARVSSLHHAPAGGSTGRDMGGYSGYLQHSMGLPMKEDVV